MSEADKLHGIDTLNRYGVSLAFTDRVALLMPPRTPMEADDALVFAAWIVALADPMGDRFPAVLEAVRGT